MLDILGREVSRGDVIVYGSKQRCGQFLSFAETKFGVVVNIIPKGKKYKLKQSVIGTVSSVFGNTVANPNPVPPTTNYVDCETLVDKATFHDLSKVGMIHPSATRYKNGRPKIGNAILISTCLKINVEELDDVRKVAYYIFKKEFGL